jgi:hypothetical protein
MLLPDPRRARVARTLLLTFGTAYWCADLMGVSSPEAQIVVTYSWVSTITLRLREETEPRLSLFPALGGQMFYVLLPLIRKATLEWWGWTPVAMPAIALPFGAGLALCWALQPFGLPLLKMFRVRVSAARRWAKAWDLDSTVLGFSAFLLSGSLVFAAVACLAAGLFLFHARHRPAPGAEPELQAANSNHLDRPSLAAADCVP